MFGKLFFSLERGKSSFIFLPLFSFPPPLVLNCCSIFRFPRIFKDRFGISFEFFFLFTHKKKTEEEEKGKIRRGNDEKDDDENVQKS